MIQLFALLLLVAQTTLAFDFLQENVTHFNEHWILSNTSKFDRPCPHRFDIYVEDGIEYVDTSKRNDTLKLVLSQDFFDNVQNNLVNQLLNYLSGHSLANYTDHLLDLPDLGTASFNLTDVAINNVSLDSSRRLLELVDDGAILGLQGLAGSIEAKYEVVSDPSLFADLGEAYIDFTNLTTTVNFSAFYDELLQVALNDIELEVEPFAIGFDGISDFSGALSRLVTSSSNLAVDRLVSILKYLGTPNLNMLLQKFIPMIPDEIHFAGSDLVLVGGISNNFTIKAHDYVELPFDMSVYNGSRISNYSNPVVFEASNPNKYQAQMFVSDYLLRAFIQATYTPGMVLTTYDPKIKTSELNFFLDFKLKKAGWKDGNPCMVDLIAWGDMPRYYTTKKEGLHLTTKLAFDIKCKKNKKDQDFQHVMTILTKEVVVTGRFEVSTDLRVFAHVSDFNLNIDKVVDSAIGKIPTLSLIKAVISFFDRSVKDFINLMFWKGFSLQWLLELFHINFLTFKKAKLAPRDHYFIMFFTPEFNLGA